MKKDHNTLTREKGELPLNCQRCGNILPPGAQYCQICKEPVLSVPMKYQGGMPPQWAGSFHISAFGIPTTYGQAMTPGSPETLPPG